MTSHAGDSVPAVDRSRFIPPAPAVAEAAPPRATTPPDTSAKTLSVDEVNQMFAYAFDHLRAPLAGSPSLESGAPTASCVVCGHLRQLAVWQEPSRVGVCASCKNAAEMWTPERQLATVEYAIKLGAELGDQDAKIEALERDAARMREAGLRFLDALAHPYTMETTDAERAARLREHGAALAEFRAALSPSGEPTATPQQQNQG